MTLLEEQKSRMKTTLPKIIAHRGASAFAPENTFEAVKLAADMGAGAVEIDVKSSFDHVPFLLHDETLDRTTTQQGAANHLKADEIVKIRVGTFKKEPVTVPKLDPVLRFTAEHDLELCIELKPFKTQARKTAADTIKSIRNVWPSERPLPWLSSFDAECLHEAYRLAPDIPRSLLVLKAGKKSIELAISLEAVSVNVHEQFISKDIINMAREQGLFILAFTVNDRSRALDLLQMGVRAVFSDDPCLLERKD